MSQFPQQPVPAYGMKPGMPPASSGKAVASLVLGLISFCALIFTGIPAIVLGFMALTDIKKSGGRLTGQAPAIVGLVLGFMSLLTTLVIGPIMIALMLPAVQAARQAARSTVSKEHLRNIGVAMQNYHVVKRDFPMAGSETNSALAKQGGQLSWRVHLLPYLGELELYNQFHLDEPWDSQHNQTLIERMPKVYVSPDSGGAVGKTSFLAVVLPTDAPPKISTVLMKEQARGLQDVLDGSSNTVMVIDAGAENAVEWTRPSDFEVDLNAPKRGLENQLRRRMSVLFADGSVREITDSISDDAFRDLLIANDDNPGSRF